jgi:hypothetical protein
MDGLRPYRRNSSSAQGERGGPEGGRGQGDDLVRADGPMSAWTQNLVRADASRFIPGYFITDATVRPSHGRPNGHRPSVRLSVRLSAIVRVRTVVHINPMQWERL